MKSEKILEMLSENKIEELKQLLREEIAIAGATNSNTIRAIIKLSKLAEKEQRQKGGGYIRSALAGAYEKNGKQCICNGAWGVMYEKITDGTKNIPEDIPEDLRLDLSKVFPTMDNRNWFNIDLAIIEQKNKIFKAENKGKPSVVKIKSYYYNADYLLQVLATFDEKLITITDNGSLLVKGENGKGIILPLRVGATDCSPIIELD